MTLTESEDFASFWQAYPRKAGKQAALKAWNRLKPTTELCELICRAIKTQKQSEQWQEVKFIPHPATWLNEGRWEDEIMAPLSLEERAKLGEAHWKTVKANR